MPPRYLPLLFLLLAAFLRLHGLNNLSPPGLSHDEVAHWLINRDILAGQHAVYFTEAYGHEAGFHYVQAGFMLLLGDNALALRLPSALAGLLLVAVTFSLARRLFGLRTALWAMAFAAVLFWPVFYSRQAIRAISLPLLSGLSAYFWWRGWGPKDWPAQWRHYAFFALAGLFAGLSLHTYMAGRAVPIFYLAFTLYLFLGHRAALRARGWAVLLFFLIYTLVAAPLVYYLLTLPGAEARISEVDAPLQALRQGDWRPVLANSVKIIGMFIGPGDPLWRQNVAGVPVFDPVTAVLFYIGILICLWHWSQERYLFLILWLFTGFIPSIVTIDAPSSIRISNILPVLPIFPALLIHSSRGFSTAFQQLSTVLTPKTIIRSGAILILLHIVWTAVAIFHLWPGNAEVQFVWQTALTEAAVYLDDRPDIDDVAVAGWTPATMDGPTMRLSLRRQDARLRHFEAGRTLLIPAAAPDQSRLIVRPTILPLQPALESYLRQWSVGRPAGHHFSGYELPGALAISPANRVGESFGGEFTWLGYELVNCPASAMVPGSPSCEWVTFWRVDTIPGGPRRLFLHLVDERGDILTQADVWDGPAVNWQAGDIILQYHQVETPAVLFEMRLGVYDPVTGVRLPTAVGHSYALLPSQ
jgi:4-amino-4-deoxy-L-arabinose transferase-like glycosyltransferase